MGEFLSLCVSELNVLKANSVFQCGAFSTRAAVVGSLWRLMSLLSTSFTESASVFWVVSNLLDGCSWVSVENVNTFILSP